MTLMILVDGLHNLPHTTGSRDSILYQVLSRLAGWSNSSCKNNKPFAIVCASATLEEPINHFFANSRQRKVFLRPLKLDDYVIIRPQNDIERLMVLDMGGHGYALELLQYHLPMYRDKNYRPTIVMEHIRSGIREMYTGWTDSSPQLEVIQAILLGCTFDSPQSNILRTSTTVDSYQQLGFAGTPPQKCSMCIIIS